MSKKFSECDRCGKVINYGNAYVSISRNVEQADYKLATDSTTITVIDSLEVYTLCGICGNRFDANTISKIINAIPPDSSNKMN